MQSVGEAAAGRPVYDVVKHGIAVDGMKTVTKPLQQLIDLCSDILARQIMMISTMANGIKFGTYSYGGFFDCTVRDCVVKDTRLCAMCVEIVDGGTASGIVFERIEVNNTGSAFLVVLGNRGNIPDWGDAKIGSIRNVLFSDIFIGKLKKSHGSYIGGLYQDGKEYRLNNICFRRVKARFKGGLKYCPDCPAEYDRPLYPEDSMFGDLPAAAYFIRHGDVIFEQCQTETAEPDSRNTIFLGEGAVVKESEEAGR